MMLSTNALKLEKSEILLLVKLKHIHFTSTEKQVLTTNTNLSQVSFLETAPVLMLIVWVNENPEVDVQHRTL